MKILAIRGKNIACLAAPFALSLDQEPIAGTGLFVITGATGSGKTSLLDTMCLALFDMVPRLRRGRSSFKIADTRANAEQLSANDVKHLLRKGATEGYAEVDFKGVDGNCYRARWEVRRARNKLSGKIQDQVLSLSDLATGQALGDHRKTETLAAIRARLGLDFEQFCRSVLLAQGEFAAFLEAGVKQRSELLERMTGTEIYTRLSEGAFHKLKEQRDKLAQLETRCELIDLLEIDRRKEIGEEIQELQSAQARLEAREKKNHQGLTWFSALEKLEQEYQLAQKEQDQANSIRENLKEERTLLKKAVVANTLRPFLETWEQATSALQKQSGELAGTTRQELAAKTGKLSLEEVYERALQTHETAIQAQAAAHEDLVRAHALDNWLTDKHSQRSEAEASLKKARDQYETIAAETNSLDKQNKERERSLAITISWLEDHEADQVLAEKWTFWEDQLIRLTKGYDQLAETEKDLAPLETNCLNTAAKLKAALSQLETTQNLLEIVQIEARQANTGWLDYDLPVLRESSKTCRNQAIALAECCSILTRAGVQEKELAEIDAEITERRRWNGEEEISQLQTAHQRGLIRLEEAEIGLAMARDTLSFEERRSELLSAQQPCPLCGATEHPYRTGPVPGNSLLENLNSRVNDLRREQEQLLKKTSAAQTLLAENNKQLEKLARNGEQVQARKRELEEARGANASELKKAGVELELNLEAVTTAHSQVTARAETLRLRQEEAETAHQEAVSKHNKALEAQEQQARLASDLAGLERESERATSSRKQHRAECDRLRKENADLVATCAPLCGGPSRPRSRADRTPRSTCCRSP